MEQWSEFERGTRRIKQGLAVGLGTLAVEGVHVVLDIQDKVDTGLLEHSFITLAGVTIAVSGLLLLREARHYRPDSPSSNSQAES